MVFLINEQRNNHMLYRKALHHLEIIAVTIEVRVYNKHTQNRLRDSFMRDTLIDN